MKKKSRLLLYLGVLASSASLSTTISASDISAGKELAVQCAACHGVDGVSTDPKFPNLAAQKEAYLKLQLEAFRSEKRKDPLMNAIASGLEDKEIEDLSAYFASLKGAEPAAISAKQASLDGSLIAFPKDYEAKFTRYHRKDYDDRKQVRYFSGNAIALEGVKNGGKFSNGSYLLVEIFAAKEDADGKLIKGADGKLVAGDPKGFTAMEKQAGWGDGVADVYKNGDWRYSVFKVDGSLKPGVNEAQCMACHKPLTQTDYSFTYNWIKDFLPTQEVGYSHKIVE